MRPHNSTACSPGRPAPTQTGSVWAMHQLLEEERVTELSDWLTAALADLEQRYHSDCTAQSLYLSLGR